MSEPRALTTEEVEELQEIVSDGLGISSLGASNLIATIGEREARIGQLWEGWEADTNGARYWWRIAKERDKRIAGLEAALQELHVVSVLNKCPFCHNKIAKHLVGLPAQKEKP